MKDEALNTREKFLSQFSGKRFRYIHETTGEVYVGNDTLDLHWNERGYGVFFTVNGFPSNGEATISNLVSLNCNFIDIDINKGTLQQNERDSILNQKIMRAIEQNIPVPTYIIRTKNGAHLYWMYDKPIFSPDEQQMIKWKDVQNRLVTFFDGDKNAKDPARILRVPFTKHLKDPQDPFEVTIHTYRPDNIYNLDLLDKEVPKIHGHVEISNKAPAIELLIKGVPIGEGLRHGALAQVAGLLLKGARTAEEVQIARKNFYDWDRKIVGSPESFNNRKKELDDTFEGILKLELKGDNPRNPDEYKPIIWTMGDILKHNFGEEQWVVESLISKQGITALSGNPGDFKTWITIHLALCVSRGCSVFGKFKTEQGRVLIIDEEDSLRLIKKRLESLGANEADSIDYISQGGIRVDTEESLKLIVEEIKKKNIKLLILDSLVRVHGQDENDAGSMASVFKALQKVQTLGASILFTHHHRKQSGFFSNSNNLGQSMRGSSDILAAVDCHMTVEKKKDTKDQLIVRQTKLRQAELLPNFEVSVLMGDSGPSDFEYLGEYDEQRQKTEEAAEMIPLVLSDGMKNRQSLIDALKDEGFGKSSVEAAIKLAESQKTIERVPKEELDKAERRKAYYRISSVLDESSDDLSAFSDI